MKKVSLLLIVLLVTASVSIAAKGSGEKSTFVTIVTGGSGGTYYPIGTIFSTLLNKELSSEKIQSSAQTSGGTKENLDMLKNKEAQFAMGVSAVVVKAQRGEGKQKYPDVRLVTGLYPEMEQFIVTKASNINSISDLKGKRFSIGAIGSGAAVASVTIIEALTGLKAGVDYRDERLAFGPSSAAMQNGQLDGANIEAGLPTSSITELAASNTPIKILNFSKEDYKKVVAVDPSYGYFSIPAGTYPGIDQDVNAIGVKAVFVTDASVPEDIVYNVIKTIYENYDSIKGSHAAFSYMTKKSALENLPNIKLHPGAIKYYEEAGMAIPKGMK